MRVFWTARRCPIRFGLVLSVLNWSYPYFQTNQRIINSTDLVSLLLDAISLGKQMSKVLSLVFRLLRALTLGYKKVQRRMFDDLDRILNCHGAEKGWENDMANLVAETFNDNRELCIEVRPYQVRQFSLVPFALSLHSRV